MYVIDNIISNSEHKYSAAGAFCGKAQGWRAVRPGLTRGKGLVREAVRLGYAENPPTLDVEGADAAHKLAIMAALAEPTCTPSGHS